MDSLVEQTLFASRWLLAPMYLGLVITVSVLVWVFAVKLLSLVSGIGPMTVDVAIRGVLALIDLSLRCWRGPI